MNLETVPLNTLDEKLKALYAALLARSECQKANLNYRQARIAMAKAFPDLSVSEATLRCAGFPAL